MAHTRQAPSIIVVGTDLWINGVKPLISDETGNLFARMGKRLLHPGWYLRGRRPTGNGAARRASEIDP